MQNFGDVQKVTLYHHYLIWTTTKRLDIDIVVMKHCNFRK